MKIASRISVAIVALCVIAAAHSFTTAMVARAAPAPMRQTSNLPAGIELDLRVACYLGPSTEAYEPSEGYPDVEEPVEDMNGPWWRHLFERWMGWPSTSPWRYLDERRLCGVYVPPYSTDLMTARDAATAAGLGGVVVLNNTAVEIANMIVDLDN